MRSDFGIRCGLLAGVATLIGALLATVPTPVSAHDGKKHSTPSAQKSSSASARAPARASKKKRKRWGANYFPNYVVTTHRGEKLRFYDELVKDKIVLINFIYTTCEDICPLDTARLAELVRRLGDIVGRKVFIYSMTLTPETDTPEVLAEYAEAYGVGPGWRLITGDPEELKKIRYKLGERSRFLEEHRHDAALGNDRTGEWGRVSIFGNFQRSIAQIRSMDPEWRATPKQHDFKRSRRVAGRYKIDPTRRGEALFLKACGICHTVGEGARVGPDLIDLVERRGRDWAGKYMMAPDRMRRLKDPIVMELREQYGRAYMPNLGVKKPDVEDLFAYIENAKNRRMAKKAVKQGHRD